MSELDLILIWILWIYFAIFVHEVSHLLMGLLMRFQPSRIIVGTGRWVVDVKLGELSVNFGWLPFGGLVIVDWESDRGIRWRGAAFALAGPMADFLLLIWLWMLFTSDGQIGWLGGALQGGLVVMMISQGLLLLRNLFPHGAENGGGINDSDGMKALQFLRGKFDNQLSRSIADYEAFVRRYNPDFENSNPWQKTQSRRARLDYEEGYILLALGRYLEGVRLLEDFLARDLLSPEERAAELDRMASTVAVAGEMELLSRALEWAREADRLLPNTPTLQGTLGSLLIEAGELEEGFRMLLPLTAESSEPLDRAIAYAYIGLVYHRNDDSERADEALRMSDKLGASEGVASRIKQLIAQERLRATESSHKKAGRGGPLD